MEFIPLHFADRLTVINPQGTIGVVTLWSKVDYVIERFRQAGIDLDPATSPIAVFGTLYGNGLREMLRNLLYNPQIEVLLVCGRDRSGSAEDLFNFFHFGLEPVESSHVHYKKLADVIKVSTSRICETNRIIDDLVKPGHFQRSPRIVLLGEPTELTLIQEFFKDYYACLKPVNVLEADRQNIPLPELEVQYFPSNPRAHQIVRETPMEGWKELLYLLTRFGRLVTLKKGERIELQNVKVVIEKPIFESKDILKRHNFDSEKFKLYQKEILRFDFWDSDKPLKGQLTLPLPGDTARRELKKDETYSYGYRLRQHFDIDGLEACAERLKKDSEDRKAYFALWDSREDLKRKEGHPCFVSLFFRKFEERLTLTATFRTHNAIDGWLLNCYGLMAIQDWVANKVNMPAGAITVISHSISIDPRELDRALMIIGKRAFKVRIDPMGYFRITLDGKEILVEHRFEDVTLREYRGKKAVRLQHEIARDVAVSDINHAIYLGRQLAKAEMALKDGREFVQD